MNLGSISMLTIHGKSLKGGLNAKFQKRKPSRRRNEGFVNNVFSSWKEMKIEHIRKSIDAQRGVMLEIIETGGSYYVSQFQHVM